MAGTDFAVNIVMVINITINNRFGIHNSIENYSCYNVFNQKDMNIFNVLAFIQLCAKTISSCRKEILILSMF